MGTNYYVIEHCKHCGNALSLHIGKSSQGWCFALRVYPERNIVTLQDWVSYWKGKLIHDEYGRAVQHSEVLAIISERKGYRPLGYDVESATDWAQFLSDNRAEVGPDGLLRRIVDGQFCIGHGEGTWDYVQGEFS